MSQRNPMNDRYQTDEHRGQTRKSAATMKPKTKAASSVRIQPTVKTKQQKKADKKAARAKQTEIDRQYYNPPTPEYKRLRKIWWGLLIGAIVMTAMSWFGRTFLPEVGTYVVLGLVGLRTLLLTRGGTRVETIMAHPFVTVQPVSTSLIKSLPSFISLAKRWKRSAWTFSMSAI